MEKEMIYKVIHPGICSWEKGNDLCFEDDKWFIAGCNYCEKHTRKVMAIMRKDGHQNGFVFEKT